MSANVTIDGRPVEIERKYLIELPSDEQLGIIEKLDGYDRSEIEQIYLEGDEGGRIRKRTYTHIAKRSAEPLSFGLRAYQHYRGCSCILMLLYNTLGKKGDLRPASKSVYRNGQRILGGKGILHSR